VVLAAEKDGKAYLVIDEGTCADFNAPDFEETMDSLVTVLEFRHAGERVQYLNDNYGSWRDWLESDWVGPGMAMRWESWSLNGEACFESRIPLSPGSDQVAEHLWWTLREYASLCRRVHDSTGGMIRFEFDGPRTPSAFAKALDRWFDLALLDQMMVRERVRRLGAPPDACRWPGYWVERDGAVLLVEERQVAIPVGSGKIAASVRKRWDGCLDVVADVDEAAVRSAVGDDVRAFLAGVLVAVHRQPAGTTRRPTLDSSLHRHEQLVASLETVAEARSRPVTWHALWRLPPGMVVSNQQGEEPRLRYPAVSFVASVIAVASECGTAHEPLPTV